MAFNYSPKVVTDGLMCYIDPANPSSVTPTSNVAYDLSKNGYNGIFRNSAGIQTSLGSMDTNLKYDTTDTPRACLHFVGYGNSTQGYLQWDSHPLAGYSTYSIESWFKVNSLTPSANYNVIFYSSISTGVQELGLMAQNETGDPDIAIEVDNNYTAGNSGVRLNSNWNHVVHTYDSNMSYIYVNSILVYTVDHPNTNIIPSSGWNWIGVGQWANGGYDGGYGHTQGKLGLLKLYNKTLSSQEILQNYNATKTRFGLT
jgi:hypothetical protein